MIHILLGTNINDDLQVLRIFYMKTSTLLLVYLLYILPLRQLDALNTGRPSLKLLNHNYKQPWQFTKTLKGKKDLTGNI